MKAVGVIVEYNPFHNGHAYHLQASKQAANADIVIAVMSGNFLQRGEPALVSKWQRTRMALLNGADLVFELPYRFAVQKAETFACGAVSLIGAAGCDYLCFGSESGDLSSFYRTIDYLNGHQEHFNRYIKQAINTGVSYPKAASLAFHQLADSDTYIDLSLPNNILGFHYIKAIREQNSQVKPLTIPRKNAGYHDIDFSSANIASATSIRKAIFENQYDSSRIKQYMPTATLQLLDEYYVNYGLLHHWETYWPYLQYRLVHSSQLELNEIYEAEEGLENRLKATALVSDSFQEFMQKIKTKRYTWTRLQRLCVHILTNTKKAEVWGLSDTASYLRLLGMTPAGRDYLNKQKKHFDLPLVSKLSSFNGSEIELDIRAARIYTLGVSTRKKTELLKQEFEQPPILV
ncbi:nucleotidyltransferase [Neobacillus dielmonensis]|uniref:nucleotidyltransferase n=1 Tax=Neobacillus dielmonensis TaxID=1347369 RepID=UPI0005A8179F|nr:nucleotidyltransferase [Neobacillus dielmonensis]